MEAAGLKSPDLYFTKPTPEDIQKRMQATQQQPPDVAMQRLQVEAQLAAEKTRVESETARRKLEMERELKLAEIQQNGALKRYQIDAELNLKRQQSLAADEPATSRLCRREIPREHVAEATRAHLTNPNNI
ncbi:hypothetical protein [Ensifer sp. LC163]|uniref:hypothetical protein n=1 Tax=Ensifer sp. LC163 TaxID=1120652 RepID=UPI00081385A4|nr:hypothetical protein [Ensifer sp. LC163]OCP38634.1 hypothetical protein BC360_00750 [Ensifer sp. LC163]